MNGRFLIARYMPDLERGEPRNIGVMVWAKGAVGYRFAEPDKLDFVLDHDNYSRWVNHWTELATEKRIQVFRERPVTVNSIKFLAMIQKTQEGNYILDEGGDVLDDVTEDNLQQATDFLFDRLVSKLQQSTEPSTPNLLHKCSEVLRTAGVTEMVDYRTRYPVTLNFDDMSKEIHFDYGIGNGKPRILMNRVLLGQENSVMSARGKTDATRIHHEGWSNTLFLSLYDSAAEDNGQATVKFLQEFSQPLDVADRDQAVHFLNELSIN